MATTAVARVDWLPEALDDLKRLYTFLEQNDTLAAQNAAGVILQAARLLKSSPRLGRPMPDDTHRRELFSAFGAGAYVLRYVLVREDVVIIVRVWHSREDRA